MGCTSNCRKSRGNIYMIFSKERSLLWAGEDEQRSYTALGIPSPRFHPALVKPEPVSSISIWSRLAMPRIDFREFEELRSKQENHKRKKRRL